MKGAYNQRGLLVALKKKNVWKQADKNNFKTLMGHLLLDSHSNLKFSSALYLFFKLAYDCPDAMSCKN